MNQKMIIETERLLLRPYKLEDVDDIVEGLNNLNVTKWLANVPYPYTKEAAESFIHKRLTEGGYYFAIVLKEENKVIGGTVISNINEMHKTAGGGIWLNEKYHGHGYGEEAWGARIQFAFEELGLRRLDNGYLKGNEKSRKMQLRFGYKEEGMRRKGFICQATGETVDEYVTGLLKEEWIR